MTKARNNTVIYFPHDCKPGRTIKILKSIYGNDGFAFWYQLLQLLGSTDGHCYNAKAKINWLHLVAETSVSEELAENIMETLSSLEAIDQDLWKFDRVIWSENFVENLKDLYRRARHKEPPLKPQLSVLITNPPTMVKSDTDTPRSGSKVDGCPQSKVKYSKVKKDYSESVTNLCNILEDLVIEQDPKSKPKSMATWLKEMDLLIRVDDRSPEEVEKVIRWSKRDAFWSGVILTTKGLRKNYAKMLIQMNKNGGNNGTHRKHENSRSSSEFDGGQKITSDGPV